MAGRAKRGACRRSRLRASHVSGQFKVIDLGVADYERCAELIESYADLGLGLVDASVVTVAERFSITTLATLNRRDFTVVRPRHTDGFELVP